MKRRDLLRTGGAMTTLGAVGCTAPHRTGSGAGESLAAGASDGWPSFLYDSANRRCFSGDRGAGEPTTRWSYATDGAVWASPVVADGTVYVGSYDGYLYAISVESGELLWRYRTGDRIDGSPAVANGTVYVGSFDRNVYALDAETGAERWIYGTKGIVRSSPTVANGAVYVGAHCRTEECSGYYDVQWPERGALYAFDADTGDLRWRHATGDGVVSTPAVRDGTVYVGSSDESLYAVDVATGERRWRYGTSGAIMSSPTPVDGRVYVGTVAGDLYAVDADGDPAWTFGAGRRGGEGVDLSAVITSSPAVCDGTVYVGAIVPRDDLAGELYAVSAADGTREWSEAPFGQAIGSSPVVVDDTVYVGAHTFGSSAEVDPGLHALETDGTVRWSYTVDGETHRGFGSSPAIVDGTLYVGAADGRVHAFDL